MILLCIFHNYNWSLYNLVQIGYKSIMKTIIVSFFVNLRAFKCRPSMFSGINFDKELSDTAILRFERIEAQHSLILTLSVNVYHAKQIKGIAVIYNSGRKSLYHHKVYTTQVNTLPSPIGAGLIRWRKKTTDEWDEWVCDLSEKLYLQPTCTLISDSMES